MISTKTVDWKIFQVGDDFLVAINFIYLEYRSRLLIVKSETNGILSTVTTWDYLRLMI